MTTIAYSHKLKQVAIDSRYTRGGLIDSDNGNKTRKNNRGLWLFAGSSSDFDDLMNLNKNDKVNVRPNCDAILLSEGKAYMVHTDNDGYCIIEELTEDLCIGSGANFAQAAMDFGKTPKEAVNYAKTRDVYTGGRVRVFNVEGKS